MVAGFRACRRCRPESGEPSHESPQASAEKQVKAACDYVRQRRGEAQLLEIAAHVGLSPRYLHGLFKRVMDTTPGAYAAAIRRENIGQRCDADTAVAAVLDSKSPSFDLSDVDHLVHLGLTDQEAGGVSFEAPDQIIDQCLPDDFGSLDYIDFNQNPYSEWFKDCNFNVVGLWETNNEPTDPSMGAYSSDCLDHSLLNT